MVDMADRRTTRRHRIHRMADCNDETQADFYVSLDLLHKIPIRRLTCCQ